MQMHTAHCAARLWLDEQHSFSNGQAGSSVGSGRGCYRNEAQLGSCRRPTIITSGSLTSPIGIVVRYVWRQAH